MHRSFCFILVLISGVFTASAAAAQAPALPPECDAATRDCEVERGDITIPENVEVRDVVTTQGSVRVLGRVTGSVVTMAGSAEIAGDVRGDVVTIGGSSHLLRGAHVHGDAVTLGGTLHLDDTAVVDGDRVTIGPTSFSIRDRSGLPGIHRGDGNFAFPTPWWVRAEVFRPAFVFCLLPFALLLAFASPTRVRGLMTATRRAPMRVLAIGILGALLSLGIVTALCITLVGIPLALFGMMLLSIAMCVGTAGCMAGLADVLPVLSAWNLYAKVAVGGLLLAVLTAIPVVGSFVLLIAGMVGLGAVVTTRFRAEPAPSIEIDPFDASPDAAPSMS